MIRIYDQFGMAIGELRAKYQCSWLLSNEGKAQFTLSVRDAGCVETLLRFGNLVLIEHESLPAWGGVIDTPREWGQGTVTVNAYSAERLLNYRRAPLGTLLTGTAGSIFRQMVTLAVGAGWLPLTAGEIYEGGSERQETLNQTLLDEVIRITKRAGVEFTVTPEVTADGKLRFRAALYQTAGRVVDVLLEEGVHLKLSNRPLVEQGDIVNDLLGYGEGASWSSRPNVAARDETSIGLYGLRQGLTGFDGNTQIGTIEENAVKALADCAYPQRRLDVRVVNVGDTWRWLRLGNAFTLRLHSVGFTGTGLGWETSMRVMGMEYDGETVRVIGESDEL